MSHHGNFDDQTRRELSEMMSKALGEYPNGRLNAQDEGALAFAVGHENSAVKILFPKPVSWVGMTPEQAIDLAGDLIKHARACGFAGVYTLQIGAGKNEPLFAKPNPDKAA